MTPPTHSQAAKAMQQASEALDHLHKVHWMHWSRADKELCEKAKVDLAHALRAELARPQAVAAPDELAEAVADVLERAPCDCPHKMRHEYGRHLSECFLFDLNIAASRAQEVVRAEPVAWRTSAGEYGGWKVTYQKRVCEIWVNQGCTIEPLYTAPPSTAPGAGGSVGAMPSNQELAAGAFYPQVTGYATHPLVSVCNHLRDAAPPSTAPAQSQDDLAVTESSAVPDPKRVADWVTGLDGVSRPNPAACTPKPKNHNPVA